MGQRVGRPDGGAAGRGPQLTGKYCLGVTPTSRWNAAVKELAVAWPTLDQAGLPARLGEAGFTDVSVDTHPASGGLRFRARRP